MAGNLSWWQKVGKWALAQCRGTNCLGARKLSWLQEFDYVQMRESGFSSHYKLVMAAGTKAKTVTSNLPLLSVLCVGYVKKLSWFKQSLKND